jgi:hypothetical protein
MAKIDIRAGMEGDKELIRKLEHLAGDQGMRKQARAAALAFAREECLPLMVERTPKKTGKLRSTETVKVRISSKKEDIGVTLVAGGAQAPYARIVHEDLRARHKVGRSKYMESVILEKRSSAAQGIGSRLNLEEAVGR